MFRILQATFIKLIENQKSLLLINKILKVFQTW